jgi:putative NADH-flavin reductase
MTTLVIGASGATGKEVVNQLILMGQNVKIILRPTAKIPEKWEDNKSISIVRANISEISVIEMASYIKDCQSVVSCLGHNLTLSGIFGKPRKLVTNAVESICKAIEENHSGNSIKLVLMNTTGNRNKDLNETLSLAEKITMVLVKNLIPPQLDNENAADYLRLNIGQNNEKIQWVAVRPDSLINDSNVTEYELFASPTRSPIFNSGKTSRINVGHFMARLIVDKDLWEQWRGKMPVIYNK